MSFLATQSPPAADEERPVANDGWFPDLRPAQIRALARLDGTVTPARLRGAIATAMAEVNAQLADYKARHLAAGACDLECVPGPEVGDEPVALLHYRNAIASHLQAHLAEQYRSFDTTASGDKNAEALEATTAQHRRNLHWAIAALCGRPRTTVELI